MGKERLAEANEVAVPYEDAAKVRPDERDHNLAINGHSWPPTNPPDGWTPTKHGLRREIAAIEGSDPQFPSHSRSWC